jgi:CheY-like chemotaxis protein
VPERILTDSTRLRQIVLNVIGNALKFTRIGAIEVAARFAVTHTGRSMFYVTVSDTGVGIDPKNAERIFQPFSQADTSTTRIFGGTGLGLALARRLARAMGGDVQLIKSVPGEGSTFLIAIEVEVPAVTAWVAEGSGYAEADVSGPMDLPDAERLQGKRILLVEDAEDNQFLIRQFLSRTGVILEMASNGEEGVKKALSNEYEVVLMDIQMPLVEGYQATTRLRQAGYNKPIIALTAHALVEEREKSLRTGCNGHLTKPIDRRQLIESLIEIVT